MSTTTTDVERSRKILLCIKTLRAVQGDLGFASLDESTREMIDQALIPIGGWEAGLGRINAFMEEDLRPDGQSGNHLQPRR